MDFLHRADLYRRKVVEHVSQSIGSSVETRLVEDAEEIVISRVFHLDELRTNLHTEPFPRFHTCRLFFALFAGEDHWRAYKERMRSIAFNMRKSPHVRAMVESGSVTPVWLATASARDMWPERWAAAKLPPHLDQVIRADQDTEGATTMFKCGKCKNRKTTYYQMQTRSADEPLTTFVRCLVCDTRWKC